MATPALPRAPWRTCSESISRSVSGHALWPRGLYLAIPGVTHLIHRLCRQFAVRPIPILCGAITNIADYAAAAGALERRLLRDTQVLSEDAIASMQVTGAVWRSSTPRPMAWAADWNRAPGVLTGPRRIWRGQLHRCKSRHRWLHGH